MKTVAFIGTGNMGGALARAACRALTPEQVILSDHDRSKSDELALTLGCEAAATNEQAVRAAKYLFLCVKPQFFASVAAELTPLLRSCHEAGEDKVLVSIAAGLKLDTIRGHYADVGYDIPILRIMPNTCVAIGKGTLALASKEGEDEANLLEVEHILSQAGLVERLPERLMDQFTAVAGCGPAFVYPFIEALADGGVMTGLPRDQAMRYAAQTVLGAAAMVLESGQHPGQLKDAVCSPAGSTIAGVAELERSGFRAAAMDAVLAAFRRNEELGKQ